MRMSFLSILFLTAVASAERLYPEYESLLPPEPVLPTQVCSTLKARLAATNFRLPEEIDNDPNQSNPDFKRLQAAINACPAGQALKLIRNGKNNAFLTGPFKIKSGVTLWVDKGVTVFASRSPADYDLGDSHCGAALVKIKNRCEPWIYASQTIGSGIVGEGTLDARGGSVLTSGANAFKATWWDLSIQSKAKPKLEQNNPRMIQVDGGKNFTFYQITLSNATKFHVGTKELDGLIAWGVKIITPSLAYSRPNYACPAGTVPEPGNLSRPSTCFTPELVKNTDGIDPGRSKNVTLAYSYITTGDDNVAIKSGGKTGGPHTVNHLYAHNHFYYGHGMSIGSETEAGVRDIKIWDLTIDGYDSGHGVGVRIKSDGKRGGEVSNIHYRDICMRRVKDSLVFSPYYSSTKETKFPPNFFDIVVQNFHYVAYPEAKFNQAKVNFSGYRTDTLVNPLRITLDNVQYDHVPILREKHHHDIQFNFGPGRVKNLPFKQGETITIVDKQEKNTPPLDCPPEVFVPFPSEASPI